jgi:alpha-galactosidase
MMKYCLTLFLFCSYYVFSTIAYGQQSTVQDPPDAPAVYRLNNNELQIEYNHQLVFLGRVITDGNAYYKDEVSEEKNGLVNQVMNLTSSNGKAITLVGYISGSEEAIPCESDRKGDGFYMVRNSVGLSHSLRNRAIYDRLSDWLLSVDYSANVRIEPIERSDTMTRFKITISGDEIALRFRPRFYQKHRGLSYFRPWEYKVWQMPIVGWCSWYAYFQNIDETKIHTAADVISQTLKPYGLQYLQIDDGYQQEPVNFANSWLIPNKKFPHGMDSLASYIHEKGLKPGIWTYTSFTDKDSALAHKELFVQNDNGEPAYGRWVGYSPDGSSQEAMNKIVKPLYEGFKKMGWDYFKVDALRHLRYEGYNSNASYFKNRQIDRVTAYRNVARTIRDVIGRDHYMLGCWGIRPELTGIVDGCRIGDDGFSYAGLAEYNSYNNIVWRNDPDHIVLSDKEAYRSCMVTSLTGAAFLLSDNPERYKTKWVEPAIRSIPVLFTRPAQVFDVDPSRSMNIGQVDAQLSGAGPRVFDASRHTITDLFLLEINKPYENWMLLGRTGDQYDSINFNDLGLDTSQQYIVFEFWTKHLNGIVKNSFKPGNISPVFNCQLFCIRQYMGHPQLIATNRHISCGALSIKEMKWESKTLSGVSQLIAHDLYKLYVYEPDNYEVGKIECPGAKIMDIEKQGKTRIITLRAEKSETVDWKISYLP